MTLAQAVTLANDQTFIDRVTAAAVAAALQIQGEAPGNTPTRAAKRSDLATAVLADPAGQSSRFARAVAANSTIQSSGTEAPDGDIEFVIAAVWDDLAGVRYEDTQA